MTGGMKKFRSYSWFLWIAVVAVVWFNVFVAPKSANGLIMALALTGLLGTVVLGFGIWGLAKGALRRASRP